MKRKDHAAELLRESRLNEAYEALCKHLQERPEDALSWTNLGNVFLAMKKPEDGILAFKKALGLDSGMAAACYGLGTAYDQLDRPDLARAAFLQAIKLGLSDHDTCFMAGLMLMKEKKPMLAIPYLQTAKEGNPVDPEAAFQFALALAAAGFEEEAEQAFLDVLQLDSAHSDAFYNLGVIKARSGELKQATDYFEEALRCQPDHLLSKRALAELKHVARGNE